MNFMKRTVICFTAAAAVCCASELSAQNRKEIRVTEESFLNMTQLMRNLQDDNAVLSEKLLTLTRKVNTLSEENAKLSQEVAQLKRQLSADTEARETQLKRLSEQIQTLASLPPPPPAPAPSDKSAEKGKAEKKADEEPAEYEIYVVQSGATLSAISGAYGVSVSEIKKANQMKSDRLQVGQKLKIPVKKK